MNFSFVFQPSFSSQIVRESSLRCGQCTAAIFATRMSSEPLSSQRVMDCNGRFGRLATVLLRLFCCCFLSFLDAHKTKKMALIFWVVEGLVNNRPCITKQ